MIKGPLQHVELQGNATVCLKVFAETRQYRVSTQKALYAIGRDAPTGPILHEAEQVAPNGGTCPEHVNGLETHLFTSLTSNWV
jgi:hypothetical protein